ncbi:MAG TPA: pyruvate kinase [Candidatus Rokubacteria bacterium]|nr:pyruvate kinase [Candidatus Rokubacteria bacterium]
MRLGQFAGGRAWLETGASFTLAAEPVLGTAARASFSHPELLPMLRPGDQVWMDDGMIQLTVEEIVVGEARCRVTAGGWVSDHKGIALPRFPVPLSCLTEKDREDLRFGIAQGVDYVAISFVRSAEDIQEVRRFLHERGATLPVIAKLERAEVVGNLPAILPLVDAVMVARGDLGVEVPLEEVPIIQKEVIRQARLARVPVIVATQMLESMVSHVRPTRAEVTDVATAIFDAADAIMLSAETATGRYPVEAVQVMARIAERAERAAQARGVERRRSEASGFPEAVAEAACHAARVLRAKAIVAFTQSGFSARLMSEERPEVPIVALTPFPEVQRRLGLFWGVSARLVRRVETTDEMIEEIEATLLGDGTVQHNDVVVIVSGVPMWVTGATNLLKFHRVGDRR